MFQRRHLNAIHEVMLDVADEVISNENMEAVDVIKLIHDKFGAMLNRTYNGPYEFKESLWYDPMKDKLETMGIGYRGS